MAEELHMRPAAPGSDEFAEITGLVEHLRAATADYVTMHPNMPHAMSMLITASAIFGGQLFATLLHLEIARQSDTRRMVLTVEKNFREGIKVGKRRAERVAAEMQVKH